MSARGLRAADTYVLQEHSSDPYCVRLGWSLKLAKPQAENRRTRAQRNRKRRASQMRAWRGAYLNSLARVLSKRPFAGGSTPLSSLSHIAPVVCEATKELRLILYQRLKFDTQARNHSSFGARGISHRQPFIQSALRLSIFSKGRTSPWLQHCG